MIVLTAKTAAAAIRRIPILIICPSLEVDSMQCVIERAVIDAQTLDRLELLIVLTDATKRDAESVIEP